MKISNLHLCETKNNWEKNILTFKSRKCSRYYSEELVVNLFSYINHIVINDSSFFTRLCGARRGEARRGEARLTLKAIVCPTCGGAASRGIEL